MQVQDVTGSLVSQVKKFNMIQTSNYTVLIFYFGLVLPVTMPPNSLCFSMLDAVGSHYTNSKCSKVHQIIK